MLTREVCVVAGVRTPVGAFGKTLRDVSAVELGSRMLEGLMQQSGVPKTEVDEVIFGHGYVHGGGLNSARIASQRAGFPTETPAHVVIKACGSSLKAIAVGAMTVMTGMADAIVAGGVESMSGVPYLVKNRWGSKYGNVTMEDALLSDGLLCSIVHEPMGITAERLAARYRISREEQDRFAFESHVKAAAAIQADKFRDELLPLDLPGKKERIRMAFDESVRADISLDRLAGLPPVFREDGTITAGNACPMNDGAAGVLLMSREKADKLDVRPMATIRAIASAGVEPNVMGIGPVPAVRKALSLAGLRLEDIGLVELNEAFAAQSLAVIRELGLRPDIVNVNGGAIALGHPVGATGAKLTVTLLHEMKRSGIRFGMVTLCMAGGMGLAIIYENLS